MQSITWFFYVSVTISTIQMKKRTWLKIGIAAMSLTLTLLIVLIAHIYLVTHKNKNDQRQRQLSRIDFKQPINQTEADKIRSFVAGLEGVDATFFNIQQGTLVYTYAVGKQSSENVFNKLIQFGHYQAQRYMVTPDAASNGCPVIGNDASFKSRVTRFIANL